MQNYQQNNGLTLIEVLVALVILSTGIVLILHVFNTSLFSAREATENSRVQMLLREKASEIHFYMRENGDMSQLSRSGIFPPPFHEFAWRLAIVPVQSVETINLENALKVWEWLKVMITVERIGSGRPYTASIFIRKKHEE